MSLILDALRRAETQRQTQIQPVYSLPSGQRTRSMTGQLPQSTLIAAAASALLVVAAIAVTWIAIGARQGRNGNSTDTAFTAPSPASEVLAAPPATRTPAPRAQGAREITSLSSLARTDAAVTRSPAQTAGLDTSPSAPTGGTMQVVEPQYAPGTPSRQAAKNRDFTPGTVVVRDLLAEEGITAGGGSISVATNAPPPPPPPALTPASASAPSQSAAAPASVGNLDSAPTDFTLNMLSTSPDPANSYVYINMRRYAIGDRTTEGAIVDDINNAGAVIRYRGQRYLLKSR